MTENLSPWTAMAQALLIGLILGIEREAGREERHAGLRDFITLALAGGLCGLVQHTALTAVVLAALAAMLVVFRVQTPGRTGVTTEIAAVTAFLLGYMAAVPQLDRLAIAVTVVLALFLQSGHVLRDFVTKQITEQEYYDTLRYLAVIFVIYPLLPDGEYGPYGFFNPQRIWMFVILVSTISWLGYFLLKFYGSRGLLLQGVLGGLASTTAATTSLAREAKDAPSRASVFAQATVIANVVQLPRLYVLLLAGGPDVGRALLPVFAAMTLAGGAYAYWLKIRSPEQDNTPLTPSTKNPLQLGSAIRFGLAFAAIRLLVRALSATQGEAGLYLSSALGGLVDVDAIVFSLQPLVTAGTVTMKAAESAALIAIVANAVFKTGISVTGGRKFVTRVVIGFVIMYAAGAAMLYFTARG